MKNIGNTALALAGVTAVMGIVALLTLGAARISEFVLPAVNAVVIWSFLFLLVAAVPCAFSNRTRYYLGGALLFWMLACFIDLWMVSLLVCLNFWGILAVLTGLFFLGIGVIPIAIIASLLKGEWSLLITLVGQLLVGILAGYVGAFLKDRYDPTEDLPPMPAIRDPS